MNNSPQGKYLFDKINICGDLAKLTSWNFPCLSLSFTTAQGSDADNVSLEGRLAHEIRSSILIDIPAEAILSKSLPSPLVDFEKFRLRLR